MQLLQRDAIYISVVFSSTLSKSGSPVSTRFSRQWGHSEKDTGQLPAFLSAHDILSIVINCWSFTSKRIKKMLQIFSSGYLAKNSLVEVQAHMSDINTFVRSSVTLLQDVFSFGTPPIVLNIFALQWKVTILKTLKPHGEICVLCTAEFSKAFKSIKTVSDTVSAAENKIPCMNVLYSCQQLQKSVNSVEALRRRWQNTWQYDPT